QSTGQVTLSGPGCAPGTVRFEHSGDDVDAELDVTSCRGPLKVTLPTGSEVHVQTLNGNITLRGAFGDVELQAVSGTVTVDPSGNAEMSTVNGNLVVRDVSGRVKAQTVAGNAEITTSSPAPRLAFESTSGNLVWSGLCGRGCRIETELFSGDVELRLDPRSSFALKYASRSGDLRDKLGLEGRDVRGSMTRATYGKGEGAVGCETFSGNLRVVKR